MRGILAFAFLGASISAATAQDFFPSHEYNRMLNRSPVANWSGPYLGATVGYGLARMQASSAFATVTGVGSTGLPLAGFSKARNSFNGGLSAGYNFYASNVVFGTEADITFGQHRYSTGQVNFANVLTSGDSLSGDFAAGFTMFSTLRGRLGYLLTPQAMIYVTGGLAVANTSASLTVNYDDGSGPISGSFRDSRYGWGWTTGFGVEDRFSENLSMKAEYLFVNLPRHRFTFSEPGLEAGFVGRAHLHLFRIGLNYHF